MPRTSPLLTISVSHDFCLPGGPLVNLRGEVIGINTIKAAAADSIAFAIPVETAKFVVSQIRRHVRVVRPYIGIKMLDLTE